jgi:metacaspase-1
MLTAHRFTEIPTQDCRNRLEAALSNSQPIARGERHRAAVAAIQSALADLNRGYLLPVEVDGYFGSGTFAAVEAFQRDYGLAADGMVAKQTMTQLDTLYNGDVIRRSVGRSVHVGVNRVDAAHYGAEFPLDSCVSDAREMHRIAQAVGYDATTFENDEATVANFTGFMRGAISDLYSGDSLLITFSGHGSQLPNISDDNEADLLDETLCFYDRMLIDDEFYALLAQLREGIRVHAVFDSCHSATVYKDILTEEPKTFESVQKEYHDKSVATLKELTTVTVVTVASGESGEEGAEPETLSGQPIATDDLPKALNGDKPDLAEPAKFKKDLSNEIASLFADLEADSQTGKAKAIKQSDSYPIYERNRNLYDSIKNVVGPLEDQYLSCSLVTLSACQDSQTTPAGQVYSLFTYNIISAWGTNGFIGSYTQFFSKLKNISPPNSTPEMDTEGPGQGTSRLYDRPFVI